MRSSTQEEELNRALSEKVGLQAEVEELRAELLVMKAKMAELENRKSKQEVEKGAGHEEVGAGHEEDPVVCGSPSSLLSPVKNYWKGSTRSGRSPAGSGWSSSGSGRGFAETPLKRGRSFTETPIKSRQSLVTKGRSPAMVKDSPNLVPESAQKNDSDSCSPILEREPAQKNSLVPESAREKTIDFGSPVLASLVPESGHQKEFDSHSTVSTSSVSEPARRRDIDSILLEIESLGVARTPEWRAIQDADTIQLDSLERGRPQMGVVRGVAKDPSPLLERSLSGLYRAYDLINTLTSMNVTMQEKMDSLTRENTVSAASCPL